MKSAEKISNCVLPNRPEGRAHQRLVNLKAARLVGEVKQLSEVKLDQLSSPTVSNGEVII